MSVTLTRLGTEMEQEQRHVVDFQAGIWNAVWLAGHRFFLAGDGHFGGVDLDKTAAVAIDDQLISPHPDQRGAPTCSHPRSPGADECLGGIREDSPQPPMSSALAYVSRCSSISARYRSYSFWTRAGMLTRVPSSMRYVRSESPRKESQLKLVVIQVSS